MKGGGRRTCWRLSVRYGGGMRDAPGPKQWAWVVAEGGRGWLTKPRGGDATWDGPGLKRAIEGCGAVRSRCGSH